MTVCEPPIDSTRTEYRYHQLRAAIERFQTNLGALDAAQMSQVDRQARQTFDLEELVLASPEARDTIIPEDRIEAAVSQLRARYPDEDAFQDDLENNGLDEATMRRALRRELTFDAVMQRIGTRGDAITETDERLFYELHLDRFAVPEQRTARHILITVNDDYAENRREAARERIDGLADTLATAPERFGELARRHSECPTAMEDGKLGTVPRGKLYPELDATLFSLDEGGISGVVESEIGLHLLWCEQIHPGSTVSFERARAKIRTVLEDRRTRDSQKAWLTELRRDHPRPRESLST